MDEGRAEKILREVIDGVTTNKTDTEEEVAFRKDCVDDVKEIVGKGGTVEISPENPGFDETKQKEDVGDYPEYSKPGEAVTTEDMKKLKQVLG